MVECCLCGQDNGDNNKRDFKSPSVNKRLIAGKADEPPFFDAEIVA